MKLMPALPESIFDICYLLFALFSGIMLLINARGKKEVRLFGMMTLLLGGGEPFIWFRECWIIGRRVIIPQRSESASWSLLLQWRCFIFWWNTRGARDIKSMAKSRWWFPYGYWALSVSRFAVFRRTNGQAPSRRFCGESWGIFPLPQSAWWPLCYGLSLLRMINR